MVFCFALTHWYAHQTLIKPLLNVACNKTFTRHFWPIKNPPSKIGESGSIKIPLSDVDARMETANVMGIVSTLLAGFMFTAIVEVETKDVGGAGDGVLGSAFLVASICSFCLSTFVVFETTLVREDSPIICSCRNSVDSFA